MASRLSFFLIAAFWLAMNALLWRSEFGGRHQPGAAVPARVVWQKMLSAPDNSSLDISHHGKKIGFCRWAPNVGEELATGKRAVEDFAPEGMVKKPSGYSIDLEGNFSLPDFTNRLRFDLSLVLGTNQAWREFDLRLAMRPVSWRLHSRAADRTLIFKSEEVAGQTEKVIRFDDLNNPARLLQQFVGPLLPLSGEALGLPMTPSTNPSPDLGLVWEAFNDWLKIGSTNVRVYRLQTRALDKYEIRIFVSRVGEILRVELPDSVALANEAILNM